MVQTTLSEHIDHTSAGPRLGIERAIDYPWYSRQHDRPGTHRTRLERYIQNGIEHPPTPNGASRFAQSKNLSVCRRILADFPLVVGGGYHLTLMDHYRAYRHILVF